MHALPKCSHWSSVAEFVWNRHAWDYCWVVPGRRLRDWAQIIFASLRVLYCPPTYIQIHSGADIVENHKFVLPLISTFCLAAEPPDKRSKLSESESSDSEAVQLTECWIQLFLSIILSMLLNVALVALVKYVLAPVPNEKLLPHLWSYLPKAWLFVAIELAGLFHFFSFLFEKTGMMWIL